MTTTWYLDPEGGADANAGTSFALRKQHWSALTGIGAGDTVRVIGDWGPQSLGNATWTDNSGTVTLAAAATATVDNCDAAWTAAANVASTTSTIGQKQGTTALSITPNTGFTSGLMAYKAVSALDLSAYSCISLWLSTSGTQLSHGISVALCSDSAGATPIVTLAMPAYLISNSGITSRPMPVLYENGGAALPSGINSIALYATGGTPFSSLGNPFYVDNIIATKPWGAAGHLSHASLFGKNNVVEPEWYPVMSISGTTVVLGMYNDFGAAVPTKLYRGTSETVTTYGLCPVRSRHTASQTNLSPASNGTPAAPILFTGGWDRAAMATQSGTSWMTGESAQANGFSNGGFQWLWMPDSTIGFAGYTSNGYNSAGDGTLAHLIGVVNCAVPVSHSSGSRLNDFSLGNLVYNNAPGAYQASASGRFKMRIRRITGTQGVGFAHGDVMDDATSDVMIGSIDNCNTGVSMNQNRLRIRGCTLKNNSVASIASGGSFGGVLILDRPTLLDATLHSGLSSGSGQVTRCTNVAGARWDNRVYSYAATQRTVQTPVHGSTAQSLSLLVNDYLSLSGAPYWARIGRVACIAGKTISFSAWMQRTTQFINAGLMVQAGGVAGVADASTTGVAANNTWEQTTLTFSPTEDGVVDVFAYVVTTGTSSANGSLVYFGDTAVSST